MLCAFRPSAVVQERLRHLWVTCKADLDRLKDTFRAKETELGDVGEAHSEELKVRFVV